VAHSVLHAAAMRSVLLGGVGDSVIGGGALFLLHAFVPLFTLLFAGVPPVSRLLLLPYTTIPSERVL